MRAGGHHKAIGSFEIILKKTSCDVFRNFARSSFLVLIFSQSRRLHLEGGVLPRVHLVCSSSSSILLLLFMHDCLASWYIWHINTSAPVVLSSSLFFKLKKFSYRLRDGVMRLGRRLNLEPSLKLKKKKINKIKTACRWLLYVALRFLVLEHS